MEQGISYVASVSERLEQTHSGDPVKLGDERAEKQQLTLH
jgi:hypothetical protein